MREYFPGFYYKYPQGGELNKLWNEAIFVLDANMLLNVYRYSPKALSRYFEILSRLMEQIWIPYQAANEYHENREEVIKSSAKIYSSALLLFDSTLQDFNKLLGSDYNKHFVDPKELTKNVIEETIKARDKLKTHGAKNKKRVSDLLRLDLFREKLEGLFQDKVGRPYRWNELLLLYEQAKLRFELGIPPGFRDQESKKDFRKYGDVILWFQLMDYARIQKKPIIFVTDDGKTDWWKFEGDKAVGPRTELVQEMFIESESILYMYRGYDFLETAAKVLALEDKPDVIEEAKEVSYQNEKNVAKSLLPYRDKRVVQELLAERLVRRWLEDKYPLPDYQLYTTGGDYGPVMSVINTDSMFGRGEYIGMDVFIKYVNRYGPYVYKDVVLRHEVRICNDYLDAASKAIFFIITSEEEQAMGISKQIARVSRELPTNVFRVVGFIKDNYLSVVSISSEF